MDFGFPTLAASKAFAGLDASPYNNFLCSDDMFLTAPGEEELDSSMRGSKQPQYVSGGVVNLPNMLPRAGKVATLTNLDGSTISFGPVKSIKKDFVVKPYARVNSVCKAEESDSSMYKDEDRKMKHRLIDRARRRREKSSIEELKSLVTLEARERPDKATVVASAVRTIKDLKDKIAMLEQKLQDGGSEADSIPNSPGLSMQSSHRDDSSAGSCSDSDPCSPLPNLLPLSPTPSSPSSPLQQGSLVSSPFGAVAMNNILHGLASAGVASVIIDIKTSQIRNVNTRFQSVSSFDRNNLIGRKFSEAPLYGIHLSGTPDSEEPSSEQLAHGIKVLINGGSFKMLTRHASGRKGVAVESVNTMFLLRDEQRLPYAVLLISTPDSRRVVDHPSFSQPKNDFFSLLASELHGVVGSSYLV
eukprot:gb/GEZN01004405.1/.p1 GENE.gb/GEZN01004405.1/~~gb/GEZN01004405.1/.p1  ORF type:complete len:415 (+),score=59.60 gb/GEZN01004405.1/:218-1462(+)